MLYLIHQESIACLAATGQAAFRFPFRQEEIQPKEAPILTELELQLKKLADTRPVSWEHMPDIPIYMDQLISYMPRQLMDFESGETLTSAMVNNYIKAKLMPRAQDKRYARTHIVMLTAICMLKHVLSAKELGRLLACYDTQSAPEAFYGDLTTALDRELALVLEPLTPEMGPEALRDAILALSVGAYARQLTALRLLDLLDAGENQGEKAPGSDREKHNKKADKENK